jgi:hypothetical protein
VGSALIGNRAFWGLVDALREAGFVSYREGTKGSGIEWEPGEVSYGRASGGQPTKLWAASQLLALAERHGVTADTTTADWPISRRAETERIKVPPERLVVCRTLNGNVCVDLSRQQAAAAEVMREDVAALNESVAKADIRGCRAPAFRRCFRHNLRFGGRFYAIGVGNFQQMSEAERERITINGEAVREVDIHACNLTIFLALTGTRELPDGDLYEGLTLPDGAPIARDAVKNWVVQTYGSGKLVSRWADRTPEAARRVRASIIRDAALRTYPALADLSAVLPPDLRASLPREAHRWAVGQYLVNQESRIVQGALGYVRHFGVLALPMHDALIVPESAAKLAREGLDGAFFVFLKIHPKFK